MSYLSTNLRDFIDVVDSNAPAPGGGSVSALASTLGIALSRMMASLAINKKKYMALDDIIKDEFIEKHEKLLKLRTKMEMLIDEDTASFNKLMAAFKLPKETEEEIATRSSEIQKATLGATQIPFDIADASLEAMELLPFFTKYGNMNAVTDLGVGAMLLETGVRGAILNVKINLGSLKDKDRVEKFSKDCEKMEEKAILLKESIMAFVNEKVKL